MKKAVLLIFALSLAFGLQAQKEQKILVTSNYTADRSAAKKYLDGQPLKDVEVRINDMTTYVKTDKQGVASVSLLKSANQYRITSIEKKNYELAGAKNVYNNMQLYQADKPLRLIMVSTADKDKVVSRLRKEIDSLRTENKRLLVAKERTDSAFFKVEEDIERLEASIFDRALEYLGRDLSLLDSANLEAQLHIMEGNYEAAEQTLPNIYELIAMYEGLKNLHKASIQTEYNTFETYITAFTATLQFDSAAHYAMMKADRYENDIQAQFAAGSFLKDFACNYDLALKYYNRALHIAEANNDSIDVAASYKNIGSVYVVIDKHDKALEYFNKALTIYEAIFSEEHLNVAMLYNIIGMCYSTKGDYNKALKYYSKAITVLKTKFDKEYSNIIIFHNIMGDTYYNQNKYNEAIDCYNKALMIQKAKLGEEHLDVATSYNNIGRVYHDKKNYDKALEYFNKALTIYKAIFGEEHLDVAISYNNIGSIYNNQGEYNKALEYYNKALTIQEPLLGKYHVRLASTYISIGNTYKTMGKHDKAVICFDKALNILSLIDKEDLARIFITYVQLAICYEAMGEITKAKEYRKKAEPIWQRLK